MVSSKVTNSGQVLVHRRVFLPVYRTGLFSVATVSSGAALACSRASATLSGRPGRPGRMQATEPFGLRIAQFLLEAGGIKPGRGI
jgi:hypothetical protein